MTTEISLRSKMLAGSRRDLFVSTRTQNFCLGSSLGGNSSAQSTRRPSGSASWETPLLCTCNSMGSWSARRRMRSQSKKVDFPDRLLDQGGKEADRCRTSAPFSRASRATFSAMRYSGRTKICRQPKSQTVSRLLGSFKTERVGGSGSERGSTGPSVSLSISYSSWKDVSRFQIGRAHV